MKNTNMVMMVSNLISRLVNVQASQDAFEKAQALLQEIYSKLGILVGTMGGLAIAVCAAKLLWASDPQSVKMAKTWLIWIVIGLVLFFSAGLIVSTIKGIVGDGSTIFLAKTLFPV